MINVEEHYSAGIYTPDFLQHQDHKSGKVSVVQQKEEVLDHHDEMWDENDPSFANCPAVERGTKGDDYSTLTLRRPQEKLEYLCRLTSDLKATSANWLAMKMRFL